MAVAGQRGLEGALDFVVHRLNQRVLAVGGAHALQLAVFAPVDVGHAGGGDQGAVGLDDEGAAMFAQMQLVDEFIECAQRNISGNHPL